MSDEWTAHLSAYLDGELDDRQGDALTAHLARCEECRGALAQLEGVRSWAATFPGRQPRVDVWPRIAEEIRRRQGGAARRRAALRIPQALAAGILLAAVAGGSWWLARATAPTPEPIVVTQRAPEAGPSQHAAVLAAERYGAAIADLERALLEDGEGLDTATVRVLQQKLAVIDRAISEARDALARDPGSDYLADHYAGMMRRKLTLLRGVSFTSAAQPS
ncbi:MAG: zf-HC2 domain-containing protein [Gemmatimonadota bacterium]|nr:MAG: zf-HC2 domain-containing protein [Gemmatimonadota bacterium]